MDEVVIRGSGGRSPVLRGMPDSAYGGSARRRAAAAARPGLVTIRYFAQALEKPCPVAGHARHGRGEGADPEPVIGWSTGPAVT